jgi:hypothetical protein
MRKYKKVTLIVEDDEETITIDIPTATDLVFEHEAVQTFDFIRDGRTRFQPDIMDIAIRMRGFFDTEAGYVVCQKRETKENLTANQRIAEGMV